LDFRLLKKTSVLTLIIVACLATNTYAQSKSAKAKGKKPAAQKTQAQPDKSAPKSKELVEATAQLKADLEKEIALREANLKKLSEALAKKQELFKAGVIARSDIEKDESVIAVERAALEARRQRVAQEMVQVDGLLAEVKALEKLAKLPHLRVGGYSATAAMIRYNGPSAWVLTDIAKVDSYFVSQFKHSLPVSAFGQTDVHNRLGFDHRNSVDVALHPDSAEGQALINYLRSAGIPFIAFRQAVPGSATGAHIHIGYPSHRFMR
jgi:hypothetical protein